MAFQKQVLSNRAGTTSFASDWLPVAAAGYRNASFTLAWSEAASTAGTLSFEGTDDPSQAVYAPLTIATKHGTFPAVGATADKALVALSNCPGWVRLVYTRSGGGGANQFNAYATLT